jgi:integrase
VFDPFTLALLKAHVERPPHPGTITRRFGKLVDAAGLPAIRLHDVRHSYATAGRDANIDGKALSERIGHSDAA